MHRQRHHLRLEQLEDRCLLSYVITEIDTLGGTWSEAGGINAAGQVAGTSLTAGDAGQHPFLYSDGKLTDLGSLGYRTWAGSINATAQVVGASEVDSNIWHAVLYSDGELADLGTMGGERSEAFSINDSGAIVGLSTVVDRGRFHAFLYVDGTFMDISPRETVYSSIALAINNAGQVVGTYDNRAFLYSEGHAIDLGVVGSANGLNDEGDVVGSARFGSQTHAFLYSQGVMTDLGVLPGDINSSAGSINSAGQIVGSSEGQGDFRFHPFLYSDGQMVPLQSLLPEGSGWRVFAGGGINEAGQITGTGIDPEGRSRGFILTPDESSRPHRHLQPPGLLTVSLKGITVAIEEARSERLESQRATKEVAVMPNSGINITRLPLSNPADDGWAQLVHSGRHPVGPGESPGMLTS